MWWDFSFGGGEGRGWSLFYILNIIWGFYTVSSLIHFQANVGSLNSDYLGNL